MNRSSIERIDRGDRARIDETVRMQLGKGLGLFCLTTYTDDATLEYHMNVCAQNCASQFRKEPQTLNTKRAQASLSRSRSRSRPISSFF